MKDFLINYVSLWEREWFIGLMSLIADVLGVGITILLFIIGLFMFLTFILGILGVL